MKYEDIVSAWHEKNIETVADLDTVLSDYRVMFAYQSNQIEGAGVSLRQTREIFENGKVVGYTGDIKAIHETENQKICYEFLKEKIVAKEKLTPELIKEIHGNLCHGCYDETRWQKGERPGEYKRNYYGVGLNVGLPPVIIFDEDKETYFMALEVFDHSDKIDGFVQFIKEQMVKTWARKTPKGKEFIAF